MVVGDVVAALVKAEVASVRRLVVESAAFVRPSRSWDVPSRPMSSGSMPVPRRRRWPWPWHSCTVAACSLAHRTRDYIFVDAIVRSHQAGTAPIVKGGSERLDGSVDECARHDGSEAMLWVQHHHSVTSGNGYPEGTARARNPSSSMPVEDGRDVELVLQQQQRRRLSMLVAVVRGREVANLTCFFRQPSVGGLPFAAW